MLISVIIPTYNRMNLISNALKSIQQQIHDNWECIVVDDYSNDDTKELLMEYVRKDSRFKYILNERQKGAQGARNTGILHARGKWIAFNDSDDEWLPEKLLLQYEILQNHKFDPFLVIHGNCLVNDHISNITTKWDLLVIEGSKPHETLLQHPSPTFPSILTSKIALEKCGLLDENVPSYQEWDAVLNLSKFCYFVHINEPLFIYHKHLQETISKDLLKDIIGVNYIRMKHSKDFIRIYGQAALSNLLLQNIHRTISFSLWKAGIQLLKEIELLVPAKQYKYWLACFKLRVDPLKRGVYLNIMRSMLGRIKSKIYG